MTIPICIASGSFSARGSTFNISIAVKTDNIRTAKNEISDLGETLQGRISITKIDMHKYNSIPQSLRFGKTFGHPNICIESFNLVK